MFAGMFRAEIIENRAAAASWIPTLDILILGSG